MSGRRASSRQSHEPEFGLPSLSPHVRGTVSLPVSTVPPGAGPACLPDCHPNLAAPDITEGTSEVFPEFLLRQRIGADRLPMKINLPLRVMKFGGTSVGDASCIKKVVDIVRSASPENHLVVVVSAMSGVTNKLVEAAKRAKTGDGDVVTAIFAELRMQHHAAMSELLSSIAERDCLSQKMEQILEEGEQLCRETMGRNELTPRTLDAISSIGERLSAPLVAAALVERGVACESIEATELIVTDSTHGGAEPLMELTQERCRARLRPLLQQGIVPVITGFIGATREGVLTTLGRNGSDYSATIVGAAIAADEVVIWSDVDGVLTADPRLVPDACTIREISYREATKLAQFGAKVLHPKTLRPLMQSDIPVCIRNTFAPERSGTKIIPNSSHDGKGIKGLTTISDVALITLGGSEIQSNPDALGRALTVVETIRADALPVWQCSSRNDLSFVVSSTLGTHAVEALRREFARDLADEKVEHITLRPGVAILTVVGHKMHTVSGIVGRTIGALGRENVNTIAIAGDSSECNISFVVAQSDVKAALLITHQEFRLDLLHSPELPAGSL